MNKEQIADIILNIIIKQSFASWYESDFDNYVTGIENAPTKEQIIKELQSFVSREID